MKSKIIMATLLLVLATSMVLAQAEMISLEKSLVKSANVESMTPKNIPSVELSKKEMGNTDTSSHSGGGSRNNAREISPIELLSDKDILVGDMNLDGVLNFADINAFVDALTYCSFHREECNFCNGIPTSSAYNCNREITLKTTGVKLSVAEMLLRGDTSGNGVFDFPNGASESPKADVNAFVELLIHPNTSSPAYL